MNRRPGGDQRIPRPDQFRLGEVAPWSGRDLDVLGDFDESIRRLEQYFLNRTPIDTRAPYAPAQGTRPSAVLLPLVKRDGVPHTVLTRRSARLNNHRGEISFPGGRVEDGENHEDAALREAHEEIALPPHHVRTLGVLDLVTTRVSNSTITPIVGAVDTEPELAAHAAEVERILTVPLHELVRSDTYRHELWTTPFGEITIHFFELDDETVWGATGNLLAQLIDAVTR